MALTRRSTENCYRRRISERALVENCSTGDSVADYVRSHDVILGFVTTFDAAFAATTLRNSLRCAQAAC